MLEVLAPGPLTTIQDGIGRLDAAGLGVPRGGAADPYGLAVANLVVGNAPAAAGLEITLGGAAFLARASCLVGVGGADLGTTLDGRPLAPGSSQRVATGQRLSFGTPEPGSGIRGYLALAGGIDVPTVLGSASTCLAGAFGGLDGRPLREGDRVATRVPSSGEASRAGRVERWTGPVRSSAGDPAVVRITPGPHGSGLVAALADATWEVSPISSRVGIRLTGTAIAAGLGRLSSLPVAWGAVQLPPNGQPIVLLVDAPTVGGYPVVAVVASADRGVLGQLGPGDALRFALVSEAEARAAEIDRRRAFAALVADLAG
ncbi:MAG TPA: biotin-dependent carboxyltransferase family protein [Candidatus Limnocylindrales bacterium]|nr:biotin-dependent carboxyltransferase family protein [Candidatus Limnocylindrales bacterium]